MADEYNLLHTDGSSWLTLYPLEVNGAGNLSTPREIVAVGSDFFKVRGDVTYRFVGAFTFDVIDSATIDATYTVTTSSYDSGTELTTINVTTPLAPSTPLPYGAIQYTTPSPASTLMLPGRRVLNYGEPILTDILHMLENFADGTSPAFPTAGQLWYDTNVTTLKVYNGVSWVGAGSGSNPPAYDEQVSTGVAVVPTAVATVANSSGLSYLQVFVNGVFQQQGASKQYTVIGASEITFTASAIPNVGDDIVIYAFS